MFLVPCVHSNSSIRVVFYSWNKIRHFFAKVLPEPMVHDPRHHTDRQVDGWDGFRLRGSPASCVRGQFQVCRSPVSFLTGANKIRRSPKYDFSQIYHRLDLGVYDAYQPWKHFKRTLVLIFRDSLFFLCQRAVFEMAKRTWNKKRHRSPSWGLRSESGLFSRPDKVLDHRNSLAQSS